MNVLALSGSLRSASINSAFCRAAARLAQPPMTVTVYPGLGLLPLFNADLDEHPPSSVQELRSAVAGASGLLIASPEYAHGISGAMKNALDWLVSFEGFVYKPVAVVNTSPRARHAYEALLEVLRTMSAALVYEASITLPLLGQATTEQQMIDSPVIATAIQEALTALARAIRGGGESRPAFPV
jgi:chromate reductase, NAD(P)H dehydrogenase (quinone)